MMLTRLTGRTHPAILASQVFNTDDPPRALVTGGAC